MHPPALKAPPIDPFGHAWGPSHLLHPLKVESLAVWAIGIVAKAVVRKLGWYAGMACFATEAASQDQARRATAEVDSVLLRIPAAGLSDEQESALLSVIPYSVAPHLWPSVTVGDERSVLTVVDKYFDYYPQTFPATSGTLAKLITDVNSLTSNRLSEGQVLRLPPVPARARNSLGAVPRTYDPKTQIYSVPEGTGQTPIKVFGVLPAKSLDAIRTRPYLDFNLFLNRAVIERAIENMDVATLETETGRAPLCTDGAKWLSQSPHTGALRARIDSLGPQQRSDLEKRAKLHPLVVVDWFFDKDTTDHGTLVMSVVDFTLHSIGLPALLPHVVTVSPFPTNKRFRDGVIAAIDEYKRDLYPSRRPELRPTPGISKQFDEARKWALNFRAPARARGNSETLTQQLPELVVVALLRQQFARNKATVNLSFAVYPKYLGVLMPRDLVKSTSFGIVSAGNHAEVNPRATPQDQAANATKLVTVTYGSRDGQIKGSYTNYAAGLPVTLVGPGCGFEHKDIKPDVAGSSFAAPYIATLVWLKRLLDDIPVNEIRAALVRSSRGNQLTRPIQADGAIDPALLLTKASARMVSPTGEVILLRSATLKVSLRRPTGRVEMTLSQHSDAPAPWLSLYSCDAAVCATVREYEETGGTTSGLRVTRGKVADAHLIYETVAGETAASGAEAVFATMRELSF
jgi:hypothetical protein